MEDDMAHLGIQNCMGLAKKYNHLRYGRYYRHRRRLFNERLGEILSGDDAGTADVGRMNDGYLLDETHSLPHLDELLDQADEVIAERGLKVKPRDSKPFINDICRPEDLERFPAFLNFASSPSLVRIVAEYLRIIPMLSNTLPPGVRFVESWAGHDKPGAPWRASQFYHLDHHDSPLVYVIVLLKDTTVKNGPFTFLPASVSDEACRKLRYREKGSPYRVTDEKMYEAIPKE
jgi:hypothetical protein